MSAQHSSICKGCWQNLHLPVVLRGPLAIPFRIAGLRPSRMNPNTCTFCELAFTRIMKARNVTIDATVLFADLRGYTTASQSLASNEMTSTLDAFYDECAEAIWEHDIRLRHRRAGRQQCADRCNEPRPLRAVPPDPQKRKEQQCGKPQALPPSPSMACNVHE
ncbi:MAG: hypothetical protein WA303_07440, partial [Bradyrhizobium sp.]